MDVKKAVEREAAGFAGTWGGLLTIAAPALAGTSRATDQVASA